MVIGIIAGIGIALTVIWGGVKFVSERALTLAIALLDMMKKGFDWFLQTAPKGVKLLFFFFMIIVLANGVVGFFIGLNYACTTSEELRIADSFAGGVGMYLSGIFQNFDNSTTNYDDFVISHTVKAQQYTVEDPRGIFYVKCFDDNAKFTLAGLDFLNWKIWTMLFLIGGLVSFAFKTKHI